MIPQYVPSYNREEIAKEVNKYILGDNFFSENEKTKDFEIAVAKFLNVKHCITVTNGTMAIALALLAKGVKAGDYVAIPNITMMSTQAAVQLIGAKPIFIDVDPNNLCMDLEDLNLKMSNRFDIKAVIYVTLNGRSHNKETLINFQTYCNNHNIAWIEDNAQSFGSMREDYTFINCPLDSIGCFSLSFHKLLSCGQGGFCVTNDDKLATRLRELKNVGRVEGGADIHERFGINNKFTDIQAVIGLVELNYIYDKIADKKYLYNAYRYYLTGVFEVEFINTQPDYTTPWFIDIYVKNRDHLSSFLKHHGIATRAIYPELTSQKLNHRFLRPKHLRNSKQFSENGLWLPSSLSLNEKDIYFICEKIKEFYRSVRTCNGTE